MRRFALFVLPLAAVLVVVSLSGCRGLPDKLPVTLPEPVPPDKATTARHLAGARGAEPPAEVVLTPQRTREPGALTAGLVAPVRMQIGPQPFVVESCSLKQGDRVRIAIREPGSEEPLHVRDYSMAGGLVSHGTDAEEWDPAPGEYEAELWVNGQLLDSRPFTVGS